MDQAQDQKDTTCGLVLDPEGRLPKPRPGRAQAGSADLPVGPTGPSFGEAVRQVGGMAVEHVFLVGNRRNRLRTAMPSV